MAEQARAQLGCSKRCCGLLCSVLLVWGCKVTEPEPTAQERPHMVAWDLQRPAVDVLPPLSIAYSDWPGWVAWQVALEKDFFAREGVDVRLDWLEYVPSMEAFSDGKVDAVCMTNGDALVVAASGASSVGILLNDYSNGNDMIVAAGSITSLAELGGKKVGVEVGFVDHLLLLEALKTVGLNEPDVDIVNVKTQKTPELLASGAVSAVAAWQPNSGQALQATPGAKALFTSANVPGLIYDLLYVSPASLRGRRSEWVKVARVWWRVVAFVRDPSTRDEAVQIMSRRVGISPERYADLLNGTFLLDGPGNLKHFTERPGFDSVYGSSSSVDAFNVANHIYKSSSDVGAMLDPSVSADALK
jgi:NitT/TauT family transport system substrate-binding protein